MTFEQSLEHRLERIDARLSQVEILTAKLDERAGATNEKLDALILKICPVGEVKPVCREMFEALVTRREFNREISGIIWLFRLTAGAIILAIGSTLFRHILPA